MLHFCRNSLIACAVVMLPATATARSNKDADAVVTLRNGMPCFSYPKDKEIRTKPYSFGYLSVSRNGSTGETGWEIGIVDYERKGLVEPNSPETCIEYGILGLGMKLKQAAKPLLPDTPYKVFMDVTEAPGENTIYDRKFAFDFCLTRNEKGETVIVEATGGGRGEWRCLKLGESRGFWGWLFGK